MKPGSSKKLIKNAFIVNEGTISRGDVYINGSLIEEVVIEGNKNTIPQKAYEIIDAEGLYLLPGIIDDQVHFRDPGVTYKADIYSESKAAVAGGVTSFMDMPNTKPSTLTIDLLEDKYQIALEKSLANYSFYMGASNDNLDEIIKVDPEKVCGVKVFMGSSTGNMLVDNEKTLEGIFSKSPTIVAVHCEDENTVLRNLEKFKEEYGDDATARIHPMIRTSEACLKSSSKAVALAKKYGSRLHILHLSTADEMDLFNNSIPLSEKRITAEVCVHHLWFSDVDYEKKGNFIKWNPAIKSEKDQKALLNAVLEDKIDVIATDHAPHTIEEKSRPFFMAPAGGPMVQHSLVAVLEFYHQGKLELEKIVEKMCHNPAILFRIKNRGYIRPGYFADLVLVDLNKKWTVEKDNILYKCGWSPMEGVTFHSEIKKTFVNGNLVYNEGEFDETTKGQRLMFNKL
jgi:dihydroorotase